MLLDRSADPSHLYIDGMIPLAHAEEPWISETASIIALFDGIVRRNSDTCPCNFFCV